jgi:hypothetical protein
MVPRTAKEKSNIIAGLRLLIKARWCECNFFLTNLGKDRFILGYPFLFTFNPAVDWRRAVLRGGKVSLEMVGFQWAQRRLEQCQQEAQKCVGTLSDSEEVWVHKMTTAQQWAHEAHNEKGEEVRHELPEEYQRHATVFDERNATRFPPKREEELGIEFLPGAPKEINCKVYPLSQVEQDQLRNFLMEEEGKGYIYKGSSLYTAPVFLISKKDSDERRVVMDYRRLNEWVVRDNGPLPNIRTQLEKLTSKSLFTKFDIRWGYKNHRIKEGDQYKAAFKTVFGTYIPRMVYFGLKNAPPFFQRMMAKEFQPLMRQYEPYLSNYLDDWIIATPGGEEGLALYWRITHQFLDLMKKLSYFLKLGKCEFECSSIEFLGWLVMTEGITVDPSKAAGLAKWPHQLRNV